MTASARSPRKRRQTPNQAQFKSVRLEGFSLLEVLIALFVLSIGLVGMAALNLSALKNVHSAQQASLASAIALDFEERLWLSLAETSVGCPDAVGVGEALVDDWTGDPPQGWGLLLQLPKLSVVVEEDDVGGEALPVAITVQWAEERLLGGEAEDVTEVFEYDVEILCRGAV